MSTRVTLNTIATNFVDVAEVCVAAEVASKSDGFAHTCPGCHVAFATHGEGYKPETGKGANTCDG